MIFLLQILWKAPSDLKNTVKLLLPSPVSFPGKCTMSKWEELNFSPGPFLFPCSVPALWNVTIKYLLLSSCRMPLLHRGTGLCAKSCVRRRRIGEPFHSAVLVCLEMFHLLMSTFYIPIKGTEPVSFRKKHGNLVFSPVLQASCTPIGGRGSMSENNMTLGFLEL